MTLRRDETAQAGRGIFIKDGFGHQKIFDILVNQRNENEPQIIRRFDQSVSDDIGANIPSNDVAGTTHKTDVQFFDSLGNANTMSVVYTRANRSNEWAINVDPPSGTAVLTIEDATAITPKVYKSTGQLEFNVLNAAGDAARRPADGATVIIDGTTYEFDSTGAVTAGNILVDVSTTTTLAQDVAALVAKVKATDNDFKNYGDVPTVNNRISVSAASSTTILFTDEGTGAITINPTGLLDTTGTRVSAQDTSITVRKQDLAYTDAVQFKFTDGAVVGNTIVINALTYTFTAGAADPTGADRNVFTAGAGASAANIAAMLVDLEDAIEAQDASFSSAGSTVDTRIAGASTTINVLSLRSLSTGSFDVNFAGVTGGLATITEPDGSAFGSTTQAVDTTSAITFSSSGLPQAINVASLEILGFDNGAANMDNDASNAKQIALDFGIVGEANGMTQFGSSFTPVFINQNGSRFGTFAGVTLASDGLMTALFDNGETRPIYKLPMATFVNTNGLEGRSGNTYNASESSGDVTLREADNGPAGQTVQGALEASTVDIGEEFTNMIVVQRAYSASAKIISTVDAMLEELIRIKR